MRTIIKIAVCDDSRDAIRQLKVVLDEVVKSDFTLLSYTSGAELLADISIVNRCDMVFMDIELTEQDSETVGSGSPREPENGIRVAERLKEIFPLIPVVFLSGYDSYYERVYEVDHTYFVQKPIKAETVNRAVKRCLQDKKKEKQRHFCFTVGRVMQSVPFREILCFEKNLRKIHIVTAGSISDAFTLQNDKEVATGISENFKKSELEATNVNNKVFYGHLDDIKNQLDNRFIRCHNGFIVNMEWISSLSQNSITLRCTNREIRVPVSRKYSEAVRKQYQRWVMR